MKTHQETFDQVCIHFAGMEEAAEHEIEGCLYRTPEGSACFAGCLIPDSKYLPSFEGSTSDLTEIQEVLKSEGHDPDFVTQIQRLHDDPSGSAYWKDQVELGLYRFALKNGLSVIRPDLR